MKLNTLTPFLLLCLLSSVSAKNISPKQVEFFEKYIRPVLAESCYYCHNSLSKKEGGKKKGGLALDWNVPLLEGGDTGYTLISGNSKKSYLMVTILHEEEDMEMPSKSPKLSDEVIANFAKWIDMGAPDPRTSKPTKKDLENAIPWETVLKKRSTWWSFQPLKQFDPPEVKNSEWSKNPIDQFIYAQFSQAGLKEVQKAQPETLIRRASLVLTGLPPDYEDVKQFKADPTDENFETYVDKLLASPQYGGRWARHWMDWYRYANTHGSEGDPLIPYADEYKDYLIRALNQDVPYDQLLREHVAGDLLEKPRINEQDKINESAIGPAHFRMNPYGYGVTDAHGELVTSTDNQIDVLSKAMLGITVSCARCHNHKFDPISQADFTRFYGILTSNRIGNKLISTKDVLEKNKKELIALKKEIRRELAHFWLQQEVDFTSYAEDMFQEVEISAELKKKRKNKRTPDEQALFDKADISKRFRNEGHPLNGLRFYKESQLSDEMHRIKLDLDKKRMDNETLRESAYYYLDLRNSKSLSKSLGQLNIEGNSSANQVSPAGSFALEAEGVLALTGIYSSGLFSHLLSDKHAGLISSKNFKAERKGLWVRSMGEKSSYKTSVRNYPLSHGLLHPTRQLNSHKWQWNEGTHKWKYWQGEQMHYEIRTSREAINGADINSNRSWFGISEMIIADRAPQLIGANIVDFVAPEKIKNPHDLLNAYESTLKNSLQKWQSNLMTDQEAIFLQAMLNEGFLKNKLLTCAVFRQNILLGSLKL